MQKLLLMGSPGAGKTSMHRVIFASMPPAETQQIGYTVSKEEQPIHLMGQVRVSLWDCGAQDEFMEQYFLSKEEYIFASTSMLLYVFQARQAEDKRRKSIQTFHRTLSSLKKFSPAALVYVLIHKIDKVTHAQRVQCVQQLKEVVLQEGRAKGFEIKGCMATTIWNESLFYAQSAIIREFAPQRAMAEEALHLLCTNCQCKEAFLLEKHTFLVLSHSSNDNQEDNATVEKLATLLKTLKLSCARAKAKIEQLQVRWGSYSAFLMPFSQSELVLLISDKAVGSGVAAWGVNIRNAAKYWQRRKVAGERK